MQPFDSQSRTRLVFGAGALSRLGELARELGFRRTLLVADRGLLDAGHVAAAEKHLRAAGVEPVGFHDFAVNPDTRMVESGRAFAAPLNIDSIIGLGGGTSMDCAKGINFLLTNGGRMQDYWGYDKASKPLLPMIAIPTTAGTGSEAQSYALISDAETKAKMACGNPGAAFRVAILDPQLAVSAPASVRAVAGYDAISHAVESYVTTRHTSVSDSFAREAWRLLDSNYERNLANSADVETVGAMLLGAHYAGVAIENSMLGAAHACANPLTARYATLHGVAIAVMLPHVVRWNNSAAASRYAELADLVRLPGREKAPAQTLATRLEALRRAASLPPRLRDLRVPREDIPALAADAATQWTGRFNPRPFDASAAQELYLCAY